MRLISYVSAVRHAQNEGISNKRRPPSDGYLLSDMPKMKVYPTRLSACLEVPELSDMPKMKVYPTTSTGPCCADRCESQ